MKDWWKNPVLQGEDNDYGDYDYLANELPESYNRWKWSKTKYSDDNGHYSHLRKVWCNYFYTIDGYDSIEGSDCWKCELKGSINKIKNKIKRKKKKIKLLIQIYVDCRKQYKLSIRKSFHVLKSEKKFLNK